MFVGRWVKDGKGPRRSIVVVVWFDNIYALIFVVHYCVEQPFYLGFKVVYGMLYVLVYHQYSLVNEIGPPQCSPSKRDTFA